MRKPAYSRNNKGCSKTKAGGSKEGVVCFVCYDGGTLFLCDRRRCHKAYHPECIGRSRSFFRTKGSWACGRHFCSKCSSSPSVMCIMCATSFCSTCMPSSKEFLPLTMDEGLCESCLEIVKMIELHQNVDKEGNNVDFDDSNTYECLFKEYWQIMKCVRSLELEPHLFKEKGAEKKAKDVELPSVGDTAGIMMEADHKKSELHAGDYSGDFVKEIDNKERDPELLVQVALENNGFLVGDPSSRQELSQGPSVLETVAAGEAAMITEENAEFVMTSPREIVAAGGAAMVMEENVEIVTTARREGVAAGEAAKVKEQNVEAGMTDQREMDDERKELGSSVMLLSDDTDCSGENCDAGQEQEHVERLVLLNTKDASSEIRNEGHDVLVGTETDERVLLQMMNCNKYAIEESANTEVEADDGQKQGFIKVGDKLDMLTPTKMSIPFSGESETRFSGVVKKFNASDGKGVTAMESDDKEKDPEMLRELHLDRENNLNCCEVGQGELKLLCGNITGFTKEASDGEQEIGVCNGEQGVSGLPPEFLTRKEDCGGQQCTTEHEKGHMVVKVEANGYGCGRDSKEHSGTNDLEEGPFCNKEQLEDDFPDRGCEGEHARKEGLLQVSSGDSINKSPHHTELGGDSEAHEDLLLVMDNSCKQSNELHRCKEKGDQEMEGEYEGKGGFLEYHSGSESARETMCMRYDHRNYHMLDSLCMNCNITPHPSVNAVVTSNGLTTNTDIDFMCESSKDALLQEGVSDPSYVCSCSGGDEPTQQEGRSSLTSTIISKDLSQEGVSDPCNMRICIAGNGSLQQEGSSNLGSTIMSKSYTERESFTKVDSKGKVSDEGQPTNDVATGFITSTATHQQALNAVKKVEPVYLSRSQLEELLDDPDFSRKIQGAYVKIRLDEQQYRLVKVNGTILQAEQYQIGNKKTNVLLEVINANKRQHITVNFVSNQGFTEDEYHGLWQSINSEQKETSTMKRDLEGAAVVQKKQETSECLGAKAAEVGNIRDNKTETSCIKEFKRYQEQSENVSSSVYCANSETQMPMDKQLDVDQVSDISVDRTSFDERDPILEIEDKKVPFEFLQDQQSLWYYRDLRERIHGPFSMDQLDRWSKTGLFPSDLRIWREDQGPLYSVLLTDALSLWSHSQGHMKTECGQSAADLAAGNVWSRRANNWQADKSETIRDLSTLEGHLPKCKDGKSTITEGLDQRPAYQMQNKRMSLNGRETSFFRGRVPPERKRHQPLMNVEDQESSEAQMRPVYWTNPGTNLGTEEGPDPALNTWSCPDASGWSPRNARDRRAMNREERQLDWTWNCPDAEVEYGWSSLKARDRPGVNRGESHSGRKGHDGWRFSQGNVDSWNSPDAHCGYGWPGSRTIGATGEESQSDGKAFEDGWMLAQESEEIERNYDWPQLEVRQGAELNSIWSSRSKQSSVRTPGFYRQNHSVLKSEMDWVDGKYGCQGGRDFNHNRNGHEHFGRIKFSSEVIQPQRRHWKYDDQRGSQFRSDSHRTRGCRQVIVPARVYDKRRVVHSIHDKELDRRRQFSKGHLTKDFDFPRQAGRRQTLFCQDQRRSRSPSEWRICKRSRTYNRDWRDGENRESMSGELDDSWRELRRDVKASESVTWVSGGCWRDYNEGTEREWFSSSQMSPQFPPPPPPLPAEASNIKHVN